VQTASNRDAENFPTAVWNAGANPGLPPSCSVFLRLLFILMSYGTSSGKPLPASAVVRPFSAHAWARERRRICRSAELRSQMLFVTARLQVRGQSEAAV
jgi:hypothetical protein